MPILSLFFKELFSFSFRSGISCYLCLKFRNFSRICQDSSYQPCKELIHPFNYEEFIFPPLRENFSYCWIVTSSPSFPLSLFGVLINCILNIRILQLSFLQRWLQIISYQKLPSWDAGPCLQRPSGWFMQTSHHCFKLKKLKIQAPSPPEGSSPDFSLVHRPLKHPGPIPLSYHWNYDSDLQI